MSRSAEILVPKRAKVRFPDRCPVCGKPSPGHAAKLDALFGGLRPASPDVMRRWQSEVPICREHEARARNARMSDLLALVGFTVAALGGLVYLASRYELFAAGWWSWAAVIVLGLVVPRGLLALIARPLFDARSDDDHVEFIVRNRDYAADFVELNPEGRAAIG
jgi:hypothetical protein